MNAEEKKEMDSIYWWHEIEIEPGVFTKSQCKKNIKGHASSLYGIPDDLSGKDVLDIGGWDGGYAFECEDRGARRVLMCDVYQNASVGQAGRGFFFARNMKKSGVEFLPKHVLDITEQSVGRFDLVLFLGVLYHIDDMFGALVAIRSVMRKDAMCIVETAFHPGDDKLPFAVWGLGHVGDPFNRWYPNRACLEKMAKDAGFSKAVAGKQECAERGTYHFFA